MAGAAAGAGDADVAAGVADDAGVGTGSGGRLGVNREEKEGSGCP